MHKKISLASVLLSALKHTMNSIDAIKSCLMCDKRSLILQYCTNIMQELKKQ